MPPLFPIGLAFIAFAVVLSVLLRRSERLARERAAALAREELGETGLSISGDPLGAFTLRGHASGVDLVLDNASVVTGPGPDDGASVVCLLRVAAPMADMIVCRTSDVDRAMGPLPSAERARTGHTPFDARYAVFVTRAQSAYRGVDPALVGAWAAPATLDRLMDLGLQWMRARDGEVEIALARSSAEDAVRAVAVAANVARASRGEPLLHVRPGFLTAPPSLPVASLSIAWGVAGGLGLFVGFVASFLEWSRAIDQEAVCGPGATLLHTESPGDDGGTAHDFHCSNGNDGFLIGLHVVSCVLLVVGLFAVIAVAVAALRRRSRA